MPMLKSYIKINKIKSPLENPRTQTVNAILNYSKSLKVKKINGSKVVICLN